MPSLYIHIPFCLKKCAYCDFVSFSGVQAKIPAYVAALIKESTFYEGAQADTVFIGGGTPSFLYDGAITQLIEGVNKNINIKQNAEFTIECNPCSLTKDKLKEYKNAGINRISIGAQSFDNAMLSLLGRSHSFEQFEAAFHAAREAGFANINIDLISALPDQSLEHWRNTLEIACSFSPEHISCYSLTLEENSPLGKSVAKGEIILPSVELDREMYYATNEILNKNGYTQYEISNYSKAGLECLHNINYWLSGEYIGLGCAAHSYKNNNRYSNFCNIDEYMNAIENNASAIAEKTTICTSEQMFESVMLELRMNKGLNRNRFFERFNIDILEVYGEVINMKMKDGFLQLTSESLLLTDKGRDFADGILIDFLTNK